MSSATAPNTPSTQTAPAEDTGTMSYSAAIFNFLKQIASATGDLSQMAVPAITLNGYSLTEYSKHWIDHPELFAAVADSEDPLERMVSVTRWFFSTFYGNYASRSVKGAHEKKPFNPILGEQFSCYYESAKVGRTDLICEQVSHHPPVTAFFCKNNTKQVCLLGTCGQKTKFTGTAIKVEQTGKLILYVNKYKEEYTISYPELHLRGLTSTLFLEVTGNSSIVSSSGYTAFIDFIPKPWFSGEYNLVKGYISKTGAEKNILKNISGKWSQKIMIDSTVLYDTESNPMQKPMIPEPNDQSPLFTFKVWGKVTKAINDCDWNKATKEKLEVEDGQRAIRKKRQETKEVWRPKYFKRVEESKISKEAGFRFSDSIDKLDDCPSPILSSSGKAIKDNTATTWVVSDSKLMKFEP